MAASPQSHHACIFSDCCWSHWRSCEKELNVWRCNIAESETHDQDELLEKWWNLVVGITLLWEVPTDAVSESCGNKDEITDAKAAGTFAAGVLRGGPS